MNRRIRYHIPDRYKQSDFSDVIDKLIEDSRVKLDEKTVTFFANVVLCEDTVVRFGKRFYIILIAAFCEINIRVEEIGYDLSSYQK